MNCASYTGASALNLGTPWGRSQSALELGKGDMHYEISALNQGIGPARLEVSQRWWGSLSCQPLDGGCSATERSALRPSARLTSEAPIRSPCSHS